MVCVEWAGGMENQRQAVGAYLVCWLTKVQGWMVMLRLCSVREGVFDDEVASCIWIYLWSCRVGGGRVGCV